MPNFSPDIIEPDRLKKVNTDIYSSKKHFTTGVKDSIPIILGYIPIGLAFGVLARTSGITVAEVILMSTLLYAGSAQFITVSLVIAGANIPAIIFTVFLVNMRHVLYSASIAPHVRKLSLWKNILIGAELTDETFAVASNQLTKGRNANASWLYGINISAQSSWVFSSTLGAVFGSIIPNAKTLGIDYSLPAMFAALLILQITNNPQVRIAIIVGIVSVVFIIVGASFITSTWSLIVASIVAASVGLIIEKAKYEY